MLDAYSRMVVGWQLATHMRTHRVLDALRMALGQPGDGADVELVHHLGWYNAARLHESLGDIPPLEYEQQDRQREPTTLAGATA